MILKKISRISTAFVLLLFCWTLLQTAEKKGTLPGEKGHETSSPEMKQKPNVREANALRQKWNQIQGTQVKGIYKFERLMVQGRSKSLEICCTVGIFSPGPWGIFSPVGSDVFSPGGWGIFSPGEWGIVSVVFLESELNELQELKNGDKVEIVGTLILHKKIRSPIPSKYGLSSWAVKNLKSADAGLVDAKIRKLN